MSRLQARGLVVRFGALTAVDGVDLEVDAGRVVTILGRNASGKSTLLRAIAGVQPTDAGEVLVDGRPFGTRSRRERAASMGYLAQQPELIGGFSLAESVAFGGHAVGGAARSTVEEAIARVGLGGLAHRPFRQLSVGQRQRAAFARSIVQVGTEGILVLDEPFAAQDPGEIRRLVELVRSLAAEGRTIVAAVHDAATAWSIADEVVLLEAGRVRFAGPAGEGLAASRLESTFGVPFVAGAGGPMPDLADPGRAGPTPGV